MTGSPRRLDPPPARGLLIPLSLGVVVVLRYGLGLGLGPAVLGALPLVALFLLAPRLAARSLRAFDQDAVLLLSRGRAAALPARYRRAVGLRLFAPTPLRAERRGLALAESGASEPALGAYRQAVDAYDEMEVPPAVGAVHGWARVASELGRWDEAVRAWSRLEGLGAGIPDLSERLAEARRGAGSSRSGGSPPGRGAAPAESVPPSPAER